MTCMLKELDMTRKNVDHGMETNDVFALSDWKPDSTQVDAPMRDYNKPTQYERLVTKTTK